MMHHLWRLSEGGDNNLGLACSDDGLVLGRTALIERRDGRYIVRDRLELQRLLGSIDRHESVDRLMPGLATVASALNANDPCLARIAAVHLRIPDLPHHAARDAIATEDALIKSAEWNPALHPRAGAPPNPGWFAAGAASEASPTQIAQNDDPTRRTDAGQPSADGPLGQHTGGWGDPETLDDHFARHGGDFGAQTPDEYAALSRKFFADAVNDQNSQIRVDLDRNIVRIYDAATNTFGAYNLDDQSTRTFFKPSSDSYWARNAGGWGKPPSAMTQEERRAFVARARGALRGWGDEE